MRADGTQGPPTAGRRIIGAVLMVGGALSLTLAAASEGDGPSRERPADDEVEVLGEVVERSGRPDEVETWPLKAPAAVAGAVDVPVAATGSDAPVGPVTSSPTTPPTTARPARSTTTTAGRGPVSNQSIDLRVETEPAAPARGGRVTITVTASDPDAPLQPPVVCVTAEGSDHTVGFRGDDPPTDTCAAPASCGTRGSGGDSGAAVGSEGRWWMEFDVLEAGTYTVAVSIESGPPGCGPHPFASAAATTRTVPVAT